MKDKINSILSEAKGKISDAVSEGELQNVKSAYIGKQGSLSLLMNPYSGCGASS
jgi:phenylalanyl-tRNA synthetase alpha chain